MLPTLNAENCTSVCYGHTTQKHYRCVTVTQHKSTTDVLRSHNTKVLPMCYGHTTQKHYRCVTVTQHKSTTDVLRSHNTKLTQLQFPESPNLQWRFCHCFVRTITGGKNSQPLIFFSFNKKTSIKSLKTTRFRIYVILT